MVGWILLLVVLALVLLACVLRLGVAAGYEEGGGWVKVHLGPKWVSLYPVPQARTARRRKNSGGRKQRPKRQRIRRTGKNSPWGVRWTWRWTCCPRSGRRRANSVGRCGLMHSLCG